MCGDRREISGTGSSCVRMRSSIAGGSAVDAACALQRKVNGYPENIAFFYKNTGKKKNPNRKKWKM